MNRQYTQKRTHFNCLRFTHRNVVDVALENALSKEDSCVLLAVNSVPHGKFLSEQEPVEYVEYCCMFLKCAGDLWDYYLNVLTASFHELHKSKWNYK